MDRNEYGVKNWIITDLGNEFSLLQRKVQEQKHDRPDAKIVPWRCLSELQEKFQNFNKHISGRRVLTDDGVLAAGP